MTFQELADSELMRIHAETLFELNRDGRITRINDLSGRTAPRFFLGRTTSGNVWRLRADLPSDVIAKIETLCRAEPVGREPTPAYEKEYLRLLEAHAPVTRVWSGPAYWFPTASIRPTDSTSINGANAELLRGGLEEWLADVPHLRPFMAIVEDGHAVSVCASVRITNAAHEAGVETVENHRRFGHAVNAVAAWASEVQRLDALALYSTSWDNRASQSVAARLKLAMIGADFHVT